MRPGAFELSHRGPEAFTEMFMRLLYLCVGGETEKPQTINGVFSLSFTGIVMLVTIMSFCGT